MKTHKYLMFIMSLILTFYGMPEKTYATPRKCPRSFSATKARALPMLASALALVVWPQANQAATVFRSPIASQFPRQLVLDAGREAVWCDAFVYGMQGQAMIIAQFDTPVLSVVARKNLFDPAIEALKSRVREAIKTHYHVGLNNPDYAFPVTCQYVSTDAQISLLRSLKQGFESRAPWAKQLSLSDLTD